MLMTICTCFYVFKNIHHVILKEIYPRIISQNYVIFFQILDTMCTGEFTYSYNGNNRLAFLEGIFSSKMIRSLLNLFLKMFCFQQIRLLQYIKYNHLTIVDGTFLSRYLFISVRKDNIQNIRLVSNRIMFTTYLSLLPVGIARIMYCYMVMVFVRF